jgi:hypothetical protein
MDRRQRVKVPESRRTDGVALPSETPPNIMVYATLKLHEGPDWRTL